MPAHIGFQCCSSLLSLSSSAAAAYTAASPIEIAAVLSTQALLFAAGLGVDRVPMAAAINWVLKDGFGQLGSILYAACVGARFDSDPKRHRFVASVVMQLSTIAETLVPLAPRYFLLLASLANAGKNVAWLATSASRAQMNMGLARHENLGDLTARATSQSIAASVIGTSRRARGGRQGSGRARSGA